MLQAHALISLTKFLYNKGICALQSSDAFRIEPKLGTYTDGWRGLVLQASMVQEARLRGVIIPAVWRMRSSFAHCAWLGGMSRHNQQLEMQMLSQPG